jgi:hypothetical protein
VKRKRVGRRSQPFFDALVFSYRLSSKFLIFS